ncbi:hypothetical protein AM228_04675 [Planktothricoides sp. SR001]|nr:hypothetical protein AM228_04675 [Planktothricoides sp. SR001]
MDVIADWQRMGCGLAADGMRIGSGWDAIAFMAVFRIKHSSDIYSQNQQKEKLFDGLPTR